MEETLYTHYRVTLFKFFSYMYEIWQQQLRVLYVTLGFISSINNGLEDMYSR